MVHRRLPVSIAVLLAASVAFAEEPPPATVAVGAWSNQAVAGRDDVLRRLRIATFRLGPVTYAISYSAKVPKQGAAAVELGEGPTGMPQPVSEGWYHGGFVQPVLNGQRLDAVPISSFEAAETKPRATVDLVWHHELADLRYRFIGRGGDDCLLLQVDCEPKVEVKSLALRLLAYPAFFTGWHHRPGARRVLTPTVTVEEGQRQDLKPDDGWYAVLYDEVFDSVKGEGKGPCGLVVEPTGVAKIHYAPSSYPVLVTITAEPGCRRLKLALWKFANRPNAEAIAEFPAKAAAARAALAELDPRPAAVRTFDYAGLRQALDWAKARPAVVKALGPKLTNLETWLEACRGLFAAGGPAGITAEEQFLAGYREQEQMLWEIKLAALLDF